MVARQVEAFTGKISVEEVAEKIRPSTVDLFPQPNIRALNDRTVKFLEAMKKAEPHVDCTRLTLEIEMVVPVEDDLVMQREREIVAQMARNKETLKKAASD